MKAKVLFLGAVLVSGLVSPALAQDQPKDERIFTRIHDVIYGRKFGTALTLDVFTPKAGTNGLAIIWVVSGGWFSAHESITPGFIDEYLKRGYTVFAVVHGSQPKFTIPEAIADMKRAVRYIRANAKEYHIDPDHIGVTGGSAGGHLSCMLGTDSDPGDPNAKDPVDRVSSRVQAVACFFPPTDFLNYGKTGEDAIGRGILAGFHAPFDFHEFDQKTKSFVTITDDAKIRELGKQISPIEHVTSDDAPTLIIHGDEDKLVPIQQAETFIAKLKKEGVDEKLIVKAGAQHGWPNLLGDIPTLADWFDDHLKPKKAAPETAPK
ncbi:prolyl oligopeptidase family serine peptidase [Singulisphaera sp. PoT]|uniref:prolyl oligopeptidase family serine peptidase n=1 Tax=Singulisphaera sp. PoT TaxID=3411797 RepID=UPI003BF53A77